VGADQQKSFKNTNREYTGTFLVLVGLLGHVLLQPLNRGKPVLRLGVLRKILHDTGVWLSGLFLLVGGNQVTQIIVTGPVTEATPAMVVCHLSTGDTLLLGDATVDLINIGGKLGGRVEDLTGHSLAVGTWKPAGSSFKFFGKKMYPPIFFFLFSRHRFKLKLRRM